MSQVWVLGAPREPAPLGGGRPRRWARGEPLRAARRGLTLGIWAGDGGRRGRGCAARGRLGGGGARPARP